MRQPIKPQPSPPNKPDPLTYALAIAGLSIFCYLGFDLLLNDYGRLRTLVEMAAALAALFLPLLGKKRKRPPSRKESP